MNDPGAARADPEPDARPGRTARRGPRGSAPRDLAARLPLAPGVYRFKDAAGRVLYLGRAGSLRRRVVSYWGDLGDRAHLSPMVAGIASVEAVVCDSAHEAAWLERNLLQASLPPWNRSRSGGQEVAVWIRLSESAHTPGVKVVYQPSPGARHFGPYLGGRKVRCAVSGLCRLLPPADPKTEPPGARRELARAQLALTLPPPPSAALTPPPHALLALTPPPHPLLPLTPPPHPTGAFAAKPAALVQTIAAVLDRDPAAVAWLRARLVARRDAAAGVLAFEFAARLQREIEALDWVTAEQKVTQASPADFDVYGWADGMLVRFAVRRGRLTDWAQRACGAADARRRSRTTPPEWSGFAQRNAELAARLAD